MFLFHVLSVFKKGDTIQGGHHLRKYGIYLQGIFYAIVIYGLTVLRVCYGSLPVFLCNIAGFLKGCAIMFGAIIIATYTFTRFMFVCIWKRMRQMDDNLIVRIATIQAIFMSLLFTVATWLQLQGQRFRSPVSSFYFLGTSLFR